jgi:branched-chain amino acid transport system ATP-binding protein
LASGSKGETETILEMKDVTTVYGLHEMLHRVNVGVEKAKITCLLGPNGAGKSTLIKAILGLVKITGGSITFKGEGITGSKTHEIVRKGITVVPEGRRIFPKMTVLENLRMGTFAKMEKAIVEEGLEKVLELFPPLKARLHQVAGTLSGGEQSMLSIGRGLMSNPDLILLDEPSLGLAPILVEQLFETIYEINQAGTTVFLAEQNAIMTLEIASYGYVLQKGEIIARGSREELLQTEVIQSAYLVETWAKSR